MRAASDRLKAYLASRPSQLIVPDCFTITLANGNKYFYTSADVPVTIYDEPDDASAILGVGVLNHMILGQDTSASKTVFAANSVLISGLKYKLSIGLDVDEQTITVSARDTDLIEGVPFLQAVPLGVLDGAYLTRQRAFLPAWGAPAIGAITLFHGRFSTVNSVGRIDAQIKVKTDLVLLDRDYPRNIYQPGCRWDLYGYGCQVNKPDFTYSGVVGAGSTKQGIHWANTMSGKFAQGTITFTSGILSGVRMTIAANSTVALALARPLKATPAAGDTFTASWGCDHTKGSAGCLRFYSDADMKLHYGGWPFIPQQQTGI
jgi:hypothetical protein